jgi:thiol-disulfide isomerase/thioredoxin
LQRIKVVELTASNFDSKIGSGDVWVEFYAPDCGHLQDLAPHYTSVASFRHCEMLAPWTWMRILALAAFFDVRVTPNKY